MGSLHILLVSIICLGFWTIISYNGLVKVRTMAEEAWSGIEVQLKRRTNLIPNLIESVKGYMTYEKSLLEDVTMLRTQSIDANNVPLQAEIESKLSRTLAGIFAVAENYPDLKANQNFLDLQKQLADIEEQIQKARRYYNGTVRNLNIKVDSVPSNIIAKLFHFQRAEFFEIDDAADRVVPKVDFS